MDFPRLPSDALDSLRTRLYEIAVDAAKVGAKPSPEALRALGSRLEGLSRYAFDRATELEGVDGHPI